MNRRLKHPVLEFGLVPLASIFIGFLVAALISILFVRSDINADYQSQSVNVAADNLKLRLNQSQHQLIRQAKSMAASIRLSELVTNGDAGQRSLEETRLREMIPYARAVRLFKAGEAQPEPEAFPPFKYQSLDMVNRTEQGETVYPEAINADGLWMVALAAPIKTPSNSAIFGSLFIYYDMPVFTDTLAESLEGQVSLQQSFGTGSPIEILQAGQSDATEIIERDLNNPNWKLVFRPSNKLLNSQIGGLASFLAPSLFMLLIALGGVIFGLNNVFSNLKQDCSNLVNQMADVINGNFNLSSHYHYFDFLELDATLARMGKKEKVKKTVTPLNVSSQPMLDADIEAIELDDEDQLLPLDELTFNEDKVLEEEEIEELVPEVDLSSIFRAYDIRGIVGETLDAETVKRIGLAIGTEAGEIGEQKLLVARDGRLSSPELSEALISGLIESGRDVIDIGAVPTPLLYFATHNTGCQSGVVVTGSHNPSDYNGLKIVFNGQALIAEEIQTLYQRYLSKDFSEGEGELSQLDISEEYIDTIADDVVVAQPLKVVLDCGNGIAGEIASELLHNLGCDVTPLYCDTDGSFPNHHPDPLNPDNLDDLILTVKAQKADIGIALDGDGDRLVAVTKQGDIVWPDRLLMLFAKDVVSRNPGADVVYDVKCTRHLNSVISGFGGRPLICRSGHSFIKAKMLETDAILGGEMSGHICFKERWYGFDDGIYAAARLLEIVGSQAAGLSELLEEFPISVTTPELLIAVDDNEKFGIIDELINNANFDGATITTIDGLRVDFSDSWGLVRASNTNPCLTLRFEADNPDSLLNIQALFREQLAILNSKLTF